MGTIEEQLKQRLSTIPHTLLHIYNDSHIHKEHGHDGAQNNSHFRVILVSNIFQDKTRIQRAQLVQIHYQDLFKKGLHALSLKCYTPNEWDIHNQETQYSPN